MVNLKTLFVEKKPGFDVEANTLLKDFKEILDIKELKKVRVLNKYIINGIDDHDYKHSYNTIFSEACIDNIYEEKFDIKDQRLAFAVEFLPGQYDQRADSASQCIMLIKGNKVNVKFSKIIILEGNLNKKQIDKIKFYYINPVDSREASIFSRELNSSYNLPKDVDTLHKFTLKTSVELKELHKNLSLAMSFKDLELIKEYFKKEDREPTITEIKVIDTYWSDHCRHTTFQTHINHIEVDKNKYTKPIIETYNRYLKSRQYLSENNKPITLMDLATIAMKELKKQGLLEDLDVSEEINACSININVTSEKGKEEYLLMFKNETHNHPTEIEPFGGAATCLGGAIRDPLSGRTYVYQAMRVTGASDPRTPINETLKGKLPQRKITIDASNGYSSYGNQIGVATGQVDEIYHPNYVAKRMEIGAVIAAAPKNNIKREQPIKGDVIILLGGETGRDGIGGAIGSSKEHNINSINECGAQVQKGNPVTERKIQRLFRNKDVTRLIKRCNDFGAGGVAVAIGELCRGLIIDLDKVPKKYNGLDGTEIAISESQERMAVVVSKDDVKLFIKLSQQENLKSVVVAEVTDDDKLRMIWKGKEIVNIDRKFLDTNGATENIDVKVSEPKEYPYYIKDINIKKKWLENIKDLNVCDKTGLIEKFDSSIGKGTVLMPLGGKYQKTPVEGMVAKIPMLDGECEEASIMTYGYNPYIGSWSPFHMGYYSVIESITKLVAIGGCYKEARLTFQEYFEKLGRDSEKWGKPFSALLGAYKAQIEIGIAAIGGKDSMSGSFRDIDVPPTLVSFAVNVQKANRIISPEFKKSDSKIVLIKCNKKEDFTLNIEEFKDNLDIVYKLIGENKIISAYSLKFGGVSEGLTKMSLGNRVGVKFYDLTDDELFGFNYGDLIIEINNDDLYCLNNINFKVIGDTIEKQIIEGDGVCFKLDELQESYDSTLKDIFVKSTEKTEEIIKINSKNQKCNISPLIKMPKPRVVIPVFPGTNCEYDSIKSFKKAGAEVNQVVLRNLDNNNLLESLQELKKEIDKSQIIMIPGGFSSGDEPDGSAKFIATVFRNNIMKEGVMNLLNKRDGLILGVCNGFQALIKLGLLPYGEICNVNDNTTLTYNKINRHISSMIRTKITSKKSPWFNSVKLGDIHTVPISHGEGRFVASKDVLDELIKNDQIATQYVDFNGNVSMDMPFNPNGSMLGIEGITSIDGRILGKMAHSERIGKDLYKNIEGNFNQYIFESGVNYFK